MKQPPTTSDIPGESGERRIVGPPPWRAPLLVAVLVLIVLAAFYVGRTGSDDKAEVSRRCFQNMMTHKLGPAVAELAKYRTRAKGEIPAVVREGFFRLKAAGDYPIYTDEADEYLVERTAFFCLAARIALGDTEDPRKAAVNALQYVAENLASRVGAGPRPRDVAPFDLLRRGYSCRSADSAWTMACLLRFGGFHATVIQLDPSSPPDAAGDWVVGVLAGRNLDLFDPWRGVPVCRASDGNVADVAGIVSGEEQPGPGHADTVTKEKLGKAVYFVPADTGSVIPDAFLLEQIIRENGGGPGMVYRSFRRDLGNIGAAVFGEGTRVSDGLTAFKVDGRDEAVALWLHPFNVQQAMTRPEYRREFVQSHRALVNVYLDSRTAQLIGLREQAVAHYGRLLKDHAGDAEVAEDLAFFSGSAAAGDDARAAALTSCIDAYPAGRWRPLAMMLLAETEARLGNFEAAANLADEIPPPYDLRARHLAATVKAGGKRLTWTFPE